MAGTALVSHTARNGAIIAVVIVAALGVGGFVITVPTTYAKGVPYQSVSTSYSTATLSSAVPYLVGVTTTVQYVTSTPYLVTVTQQQTTTAQVWSIGSTTLTCNQYTYGSVSLSIGMNVQVSWSASDTADVYVFTSTEFSAYQNSGTTSPNVAGGGNEPASGSLSFYVSGAGTYYLVIHNPHNGVLCLGASNLGIYSATGTAVYTVPTQTYVTQTQTFTTYSQTVVTQTYTTTVTSMSTGTQYITFTLTSTSTTTCTPNFWNWLFGSKSC